MILVYLHEIRHLHQYTSSSNIMEYISSNNERSERDAERYAIYTLIKKYQIFADYFNIKLSLSEFKRSNLFNRNLDAWFKKGYTIKK